MCGFFFGDVALYDFSSCDNVLFSALEEERKHYYYVPGAKKKGAIIKEPERQRFTRNAVLLLRGVRDLVPQPFQQYQSEIKERGRKSSSYSFQGGEDAD